MYKHILFIEDELYIAELYAQVLQTNKYKVTIIGDGTKGLAEAQTGKYDLILLDLMLPNTSGMDILRALRDPVRSPKVATDTDIVVLTNLDDGYETRKEIQELAQAYLLKVEITPKQLVKVIRDMERPILSAQKAWTSARL